MDYDMDQEIRDQRGINKLRVGKYNSFHNAISFYRRDT